MKALYTLFLLTLSVQLNAQTYEWTKTFGGNGIDRGYAVTTDPSGYIYITGSYADDSVDFDPSSDTAFLSLTGGADIFLAKYDPNGNLVWAKSIGGLDSEEGKSIALDKFGNIFIAGFFYYITDFDPSPSVANLTAPDSTINGYIAKYDNNGNYLWAHAIKGSDQDIAIGLMPDHWGNVYISGYFSDSIDIDPSPAVDLLISNGGKDGFFVKYDAAGNYQWGFSLGSTSNDLNASILTDTMHYVYLTGSLKGTIDLDPSPSVFNLTSPSATTSFIAKYDDNGNFIWAKNIGSELNYLAFDSMGNLCVSGYYQTTRDFDPGLSSYNLTPVGMTDIAIAKYDVNGNFIWAKSIGGPSTDMCNGIAVDMGSNIYITGYFWNTADFDPGPSTVNYTAAGGTEAFVAKYNASGNYIWANKIGSSSDEAGLGINISNMSDLYIIGYFTGSVDFDPTSIVETHSSKTPGFNDIFLTKYENPTTAIQAQEPGNNLFHIYPNPTNGTLFCEISENTQVYIYNTSGSLIYSQSLNTGKHLLDISQYPVGLYLVRSGISQHGLLLIKE